MASIARQRLMNEFKELDKEKWVNVEVRQLETTTRLDYANYLDSCAKGLASSGISG